MQLLTAKFAQIASEIDTTNAQITALQTKLGELQEFQQQLLSVEQAVQSALSQTDTALMMLTHVDPSQIEIFQNALTVKFAPGAVAMIQPSAPEPATEQPDPIAPTPDAPLPAETDAVIDIQATASPEPTTATEPDMNIEKELANMPLPLLRSLAKSKKVDARGSAANITRRLKKIVTPADLRAAA